jgi:hypothetical protein
MSVVECKSRGRNRPSVLRHRSTIYLKKNLKKVMINNSQKPTPKYESESQTSGVSRGGLGDLTPPPPHPREIPKFWQSWAKFPVRWKTHP